MFKIMPGLDDEQKQRRGADPNARGGVIWADLHHWMATHALIATVSAVLISLPFPRRTSSSTCGPFSTFASFAGGKWTTWFSRARTDDALLNWAGHLLETLFKFFSSPFQHTWARPVGLLPDTGDFLL